MSKASKYEKRHRERVEDEPRRSRDSREERSRKRPRDRDLHRDGRHRHREDRNVERPRRNRSRSREQKREERPPPSRWENSPSRTVPPTAAVTDATSGDAAPNGGRNLQRNLQKSGVLDEEFSTYKGVVIKYNEPVEAAMPQVRWRVYVFKPGCEPEKLYIHRQSAYLVSRDRKIADVPFDHPSISKQHAVLQYRKAGGDVKLYLMDLDSANGTYLNGKKLEPRRYYEILQKDVVKFGFSSRECVFLTEDALEADSQL